EILNEFQIDKSNAISYISDSDLSKADGFAKNLAVVPEDSENSPESANIHGECALLVDITTGEVLFQKNPHTRVYPASTTKCLTAMLAIKYGDTESSRVVGDEIIITEDNVVMCDYRTGDTIPFDIAIHGALLKSGNDAAAVLALFAADSLEDFADLANREVYALGATNSHFVNPHGLMDYDHYTTAYDMYLIFKEAIKYDYFVKVISDKAYANSFQRTTQYGTYTIPCSYSTSNPFFTGAATAPGHVEVIGGKSGYTEVARRSYVLLAEANGHQYIAIVMKDETYKYLCDDLSYLLTFIPE
ncbi:MAG: D-alanyl-D-alanine carboxypeptidase family protein, partial [Butyrivibrio sp.]